MKKALLMSLSVLALGASVGQAAEMTEFHAASIDLNGFRGVVFYTDEVDGYHLLTTIAEGERGMPVRFEATLIDGQKAVISVPGKVGEKDRRVEISRMGSTLMLTEPPLTTVSMW
jgi:hypothetical protein